MTMTSVIIVVVVSSLSFHRHFDMFPKINETLILDITGFRGG